MTSPHRRRLQSQQHPKTRPQNQRHQVRIIGGQWRSRRIKFCDVGDIRPTPDRVRETLFNWLGQRLDGWRVLDLFCGSGILGFEALSRGASEAVFVDASRPVLTTITAEAVKLNASERIDCQQRTLPQAPWHLAGRFDLVFIDPPYQQPWLAPCLQPLLDEHLIDEDSRVYLEWSCHNTEPTLPEGWHWHRRMHTQSVACGLMVHDHVL